MSAIIRSSFQHDLYPLWAEFFGSPDLPEWKAFYPLIFAIRNSKKAAEIFVETGDLGLGRELPENASITYDSTQEAGNVVVNHTRYVQAIAISDLALQDGQSGEVLKFKAEELIKSMRKTKETVVHARLNNATSSVYLGTDQVALASASHPSEVGNQSNIVTGNPAFSEAALEQMCIQIKKAVTRRGTKAHIEPKMLLLPPELEFEAERVMGSDKRVNTADNDLNAIRSLGKFSQGYLVDPYLTSATAFFGITDAPEGLELWEREEIQTSQDDHFDTFAFRAKVWMRFLTVHKQWRAVYYSAGSAS